MPNGDWSPRSCEMANRPETMPAWAGASHVTIGRRTNSIFMEKLHTPSSALVVVPPLEGWAMGMELRAPATLGQLNLLRIARKIIAQ